MAITSGGSAVSTVATGAVVTLTATVTAGNASVTPGQVKFCDASSVVCADTALLGTTQLTSAGTAVFSFVPGYGVHSYQAIFVGTKLIASSKSTLYQLAVGGLESSTTLLTVSGTPGNYSLTGRVYVHSEKALLQTNAITFLDTTNNQTLGPASVSIIRGIVLIKSSLYFANNATGGLLADFNNDGKLDLVVQTSVIGNCGQIVPSIEISLGNGDGTFADPQKLNGAFACTSIATGDFNNDGNADLALGDGILLLGNGNGTFTNATIPDLGNAQLVVGDFNNDGNADIIASNGVTLLGQGNGTFTSSSNATLAATSSPHVIQAVDLNGDGNLDLVSINNADPNDSSVLVLLGNGDGTLRAQPLLDLGPQFSAGSGGFVTGDFNTDGKVDLVLVGTMRLANGSVGTTNGFLSLFGDGTGGFTFSPSPQTVPYSICCATSITITSLDYDRDGNLDIALLDSESGYSVLRGDGIGNFTQWVTENRVAQGSPAKLTLLNGDLNGDGFSDLVILNSDANPMSPSLSYVAPTTQFQTMTATLSNISIPGTGIHNIQATYAGSASYVPSASSTVALTAQQVPTALTLTANPVASFFGQQVVLTATLTPSSALGSSNNGETLSFMNGATALGSSTLNSGVATLTLTSLPVGTNSLTAVYPGDANFATSSGATSLVVSPALTPAAPTITGATSASQTVSAGGTATYTFNIAPGSGSAFPSAVNFTVTGLPTGAASTFSPPTIASGSGATTVTMTVQVPAQSAALLNSVPNRPRGGNALPAIALGLLVLPLAWSRKRLRTGMPALLLTLFLSIAASFIAGCGGSNSTSTTTVQSKTYTLLMTANSNGLSSTSTFTLIVK
ncbi:MAG: FG-GAP-like repeat-containing protein [Granulicella sp.]